MTWSFCKPAKCAPGYCGTATGVDTVEDDRWRTGHPEIPARADFALDRHKDLPAGLVVVKELFGHLLAVQCLQHGFKQRGEALQSTGYRSGRDRESLIAQVLQVAVGGLSVAIFAQDDLHPEADLIVATRNQSGRWRGGDDCRGIVAGTARVACIGWAGIATDMCANLNFYDIALLIQRRLAQMR